MGAALLVLGFVAAVGAVWAYQHFTERRRTAELAEVARELGFEFVPHGDGQMLAQLNRFPLFTQGRGRRLYNLMRGRSRELEVAIVDYNYVTGHGKQRRTWKLTAVVFRFGGPNLPAFAVQPETLWHKVGAWFGGADIDFPSHPTFSRKYLLKGKEPDAVRALFEPAVLDYFEQSPGLHVQGAGGTLVYYAPSRVRPAGVRDLLEGGFHLLPLFRPGG
jgi:hypothetical protein